MIHDETVLKLCVAPDGVVWAADGTRPPASTGLSVDAFVTTFAPRPVRLLGCARNVQLIDRLFTVCTAGGTVVELATPSLCVSRAEREDPTIVLYRMRQCRWAPSLGGWHAMTAAEHVTYAMAARRAKSMVFQHPVWYDLAFIPTISHGGVAELLMEIRDPRWFVDPRHPMRVSRLQTFLGLTPGNVQWTQECAQRFREVTPWRRRCLMAIAAWGYSPRPAVSPQVLACPGGFLWRRLATHPDQLRGILRVTQTFVAYLYFTWLEALRAGASWRPDPLFDPERLFKTREEIDAYREYARNRPRPV